jgi:uncharacterized membrane protein YfhO
VSTKKQFFHLSFAIFYFEFAFVFACFFSLKVIISAEKKEERSKNREKRKAEERSHQVFVVCVVTRNLLVLVPHVFQLRAPVRGAGLYQHSPWLGRWP